MNRLTEGFIFDMDKMNLFEGGSQEEILRVRNTLENFWGIV